MRRAYFCVPMMTLCLLLSGCGGDTTQAETLSRTIQEEYAALNTCSGTAELTADYGQRVYQYTLEFSQADGELTLTVTAPAEVAGITAHVSEGETALEYDGVMLETGPLTTDGLSPVSALPALLRCAGSGFSDQCGTETTDGQTLLRLTCRNPSRSPGEGTEYTLWFDPETHALVRGEILSDGFRVIDCTFTAFNTA